MTIRPLTLRFKNYNFMVWSFEEKNKAYAMHNFEDFYGKFLALRQSLGKYLAGYVFRNM